jgi:hypothetical protein
VSAGSKFVSEARNHSLIRRIVTVIALALVGASSLVLAASASTRGSEAHPHAVARAAANHYASLRPANDVVANDFAIAASDVAVVQGGSGNSAVSTTLISGSPEPITLQSSGLPSGATASFNPNPVTSGDSSNLTINSGTAAAGQYTVTVTGAGRDYTHAATFRLTITAAPPPPPPGNAVQNPGFETGDFRFWARSGVVLPTIGQDGHTGRYSARAGAPFPYRGNSFFQQTVIVPAGTPTLSFWYKPSCADSIVYDQIQMQIRDIQGALLATILDVCSNTSTWTFKSYDISRYAGRTIVLWFNAHDGGRRNDPTYALFDDVFIG